MANDNKLLGNFDLVGIAPAPRGVPQVEVTFDIDANGIVNVSATDKATGKSQEIKVQSSGGLSDADIDRMVKEAEANAENDKKRREVIEVTNDADSLIYSTERTLSEHKDKIKPETKEAVELAIKEMRDALGRGDDADLDELKDKKSALQKAAQEIGSNLYSTSNSSEESANKENQNTENVQDAEFTDKDEKKK